MTPPKTLTALVTLALVNNSLQAPPAANATAACTTYVANGVPGGFTQRVLADFSGATTGAETTYGLNDPDHPFSSKPLVHTFIGSNTALKNGALNLKASAYSGTGPVQGAKAATDDNFKYASVRTVLKSSKTRGVVEGNFFHPNVQAGIWATNQALNNKTVRTSQRVPFTFDPSEAFHEYRIDWSAAATTFYIDGQQKARLTTNLSTQAGPWVWNAWSSGDPCWSGGPPTVDPVTQIRSMEICKGWTSTVSGAVCNV